MSGTRGAGRGTPAAPANISLNARGYPGERNYVVAATDVTVVAVDGEETLGDPVGMHIRVIPKASFETGDLRDAQDRLIDSYIGSTDPDDEIYTYGFAEPLDPVPDIANGEEWLAIVIGRCAQLLAGAVGPNGVPTNQFILPATFKGADRDTITGTTIRFLTGALEEHTFVASAYDVATRTVTVEPHWAQGEGPAAGDSVAVYGERVGARVLSSGDLELMNPLHVDGTLAGNHPVHGAVNTTYRNTYRGMQMEVVAIESGNTYQLGTIGEISASIGTTAFLASPINLKAGEVVTLMLTGGWISQFVPVGDNTHALTQISVGARQFGVRHTLQSAAESGYGNMGQRVVHRETRDCGLRRFDAEPGVAMESATMVGAYYRVALVAYTPSLTGALRVRFASTAAAAEAQIDSGHQAARLTDSASGGGVADEVSIVAFPPAATGAGSAPAAALAVAVVNDGPIDVKQQTFTPHHIEGLDASAVAVGAQTATTVRYINAYNTSITTGYYVKAYDTAAVPTEATPPVLTLFIPPEGTVTAQLDISMANGYALRASSHAGTGPAGGPPAATVYVSTART